MENNAQILIARFFSVRVALSQISNLSVPAALICKNQLISIKKLKI
jgi:hypothetical protein